MKKIYLLTIGLGMSGITYAQSAIDAYRLSQPDLKGTARFMSMGGAFGALGGDLSSLSQNPAGIGVYRSNEIGFTLNLDAQNSTSTSSAGNFGSDQTKFLLNNIGGVATLRLNSDAMPNLNIGFTYNKAVSFNRKYGGNLGAMQTSMSNYIAGIANNNGLTVADVQSESFFDPYNPTDGGIAAPWLTILGYDSYLIDPAGDPDNPNWFGQWGSAYTDPITGRKVPGTSGTANYSVLERGSVDEYNIAIGGNINNIVYWGMNFDIVNLDYRLDALYGENMENAWVYNPESGTAEQTTSKWNMQNFYRVNGSGFNYQLGLIVKPIQELRLGVAFHTPTYYNLTETYSADVNMDYYGQRGKTSTNNDMPAYNDMNLHSPWKVIVSAAGVIGSKFIISADYEIDMYDKMKFTQSGSGYWGYDYGYDDWWDWDYMSATPMAITKGATKASSYDPFSKTNNDIKNIYRSTNTLRLGAEYRVTPQFSVRAGYSFVSSPVKAEVRNGEQTIYTAGTMTNYRFDNTTNYITCGLGYKIKGFYVDLAYVYKHMNSEYHAFTSDPMARITSPHADVKFNNSQIVLSCGLKF